MTPQEHQAYTQLGNTLHDAIIRQFDLTERNTILMGQLIEAATENVTIRKYRDAQKRTIENFMQEMRELRADKEELETGLAAMSKVNAQHTSGENYLVSCNKDLNKHIVDQGAEIVGLRMSITEFKRALNEKQQVIDSYKEQSATDYTKRRMLDQRGTDLTRINKELNAQLMGTQSSTEQAAVIQQLTDEISNLVNRCRNAEDKVIKLTYEGKNKTHSMQLLRAMVGTLQNKLDTAKEALA